MAKTTKDAEGSLEDLKKRAAASSELNAQIRAHFQEARQLAKQDRRSSRGKMGLVEAAALRGTLDAIDLEPAVFASLADEDEGHDPKKVETDLLRERFNRHEIYTRLAEELTATAKLLTDAALTNGAMVRPLCLAAYEIAKPISKRNPAMREKITALIDYYAANAEAAAETRQANKAKKE
jgi:hypothetical protein